MPFTDREPSLLMEWCIDCHRNPRPSLRDEREVFDIRWRPPPDQPKRGDDVFANYKIHDSRYLTSCTTCHR